ncbi:hypothetical protein GJ496_006271 [Pomphorhynchus laevis]|nr:hypothetical protein GJ496_006271 [Pomphorhynchus laevis]
MNKHFLQFLQSHILNHYSSLRFIKRSQPVEIPQDYLREHLPTGRYVCPLQRLSINFCKENTTSYGIRCWLEQHLREFASKHSNVCIYVLPKRHSVPKLVGNYLGGRRQEICVANYSVSQVNEYIMFMTTRQGFDLKKLIYHHHTDYPSIQSVWNPYYFANVKDSIRTYPDDELNFRSDLDPSATETIMKMFKEQQSLPVD